MRQAVLIRREITTAASWWLAEYFGLVRRIQQKHAEVNWNTCFPFVIEPQHAACHPAPPISSDDPAIVAVAAAWSADSKTRKCHHSRRQPSFPSKKSFGEIFLLISGENSLLSSRTKSRESLMKFSLETRVTLRSLKAVYCKLIEIFF